MSSKALKVLFLTRYPVEGASSRYRVFQYVPHLQAMGVDCTVQSFMDAAMYRLSLSPGRTAAKAVATARAILRRLGTVRRWRDYDVLYLQRELFPLGPPWVERWLKRSGAVLFYDYDDALFIKKASRYSPFATALRRPDKTLELFSLVDRVVAGNDWLRDAAIGHGGRAITVEVAEDTTRIPMHVPHTNERPITIGWLGSPSTVKYLNLVAPVLKEVARRFPQARFEVMGGGDFHMDGVPWTLSEWSLEGELEALARFDIGLMPLPMEEWSRGKSGGKARTYMAAGVVPVCAAVGYNLELIRHGETGFLCSTSDEWRDAICRLVEDAGLRQQVATAARSEVEQRFAPARKAAELKSLFDAVLAERRAA